MGVGVLQLRQPPALHLAHVAERQVQDAAGPALAVDARADVREGPPRLFAPGGGGLRPPLPPFRLVPASLLQVPAN